MINRFILFSLLTFLFASGYGQKRSKDQLPKMMFGDTSRIGVPFAKDPYVIRFQGKYLMYYSIPPYKDQSNPVQGWGVGIAESRA